MTSAVAAAPFKVIAFVPLSVSSLNKIVPALEADPLNTGAVKVLFVSVCVPVSDTSPVAPVAPVGIPKAKLREASDVEPALATVAVADPPTATVLTVTLFTSIVAALPKSPFLVK